MSIILCVFHSLAIFTRLHPFPWKLWPIWRYFASLVRFSLTVILSNGYLSRPAFPVCRSSGHKSTSYCSLFFRACFFALKKQNIFDQGLFVFRDLETPQGLIWHIPSLYLVFWYNKSQCSRYAKQWIIYNILNL